MREGHLDQSRLNRGMGAGIVKKFKMGSFQKIDNISKSEMTREGLITE